MIVTASANGQPEASESDGFHGSNADIGFDAEYIQQELVTRSRGQDQAYEMLARATENLVAAKHDLRMSWGSTLDRFSRGRTAPAAKAMAEGELREQIMRVEKAEGEKELANQLLRKLQSQLTAAQTMEKVWRAQFQLETRS